MSECECLTVCSRFDGTFADDVPRGKSVWSISLRIPKRACETHKYAERSGRWNEICAYIFIIDLKRSRRVQQCSPRNFTENTRDNSRLSGPDSHGHSHKGGRKRGQLTQLPVPKALGDNQSDHSPARRQKHCSSLSYARPNEVAPPVDYTPGTPSAIYPPPSLLIPQRRQMKRKKRRPADLVSRTASLSYAILLT